MRASKIHMSKPKVDGDSDDEAQHRVETETSNRFDASLSLRESLSASKLCPESSLKNRVSALEQAMTMQARRDDVTYQNIIALSKDGTDTQEKMTALVTGEVGRIDELISAFRQEVRHRFELQNAENKRLSQHIVALKAENRQLTSDLASAMERLTRVELEFADSVSPEEEVAIDGNETI